MTIYVTDKHEFSWDSQLICLYFDHLLKQIKQEHEKNEKTMQKRIAADSSRALFWATGKKKVVSKEEEISENDMFLPSFSPFS
jgi:hypothetical protein